MPENATYGVVAIMGFIFLVISIGITVDIVIYLQILATWNTLWVIPMGLVFVGWNMLFIFGIASFLGIGD